MDSFHESLNSVLVLTNCIVDLAHIRKRGRSSSSSAEAVALYLKSLKLLETVLSHAKDQLTKNGIKMTTRRVVRLLTQLNDMYKHSLCQLKLERSPHNLTFDQAQTITNGDKLLYDHAIELCRQAAIEEIFGKDSKCIKMYKEAQLIFHYLCQECSICDDRRILNEYNQAVQRRLLFIFNRTNQRPETPTTPTTTTTPTSKNNSTSRRLFKGGVLKILKLINCAGRSSSSSHHQNHHSPPLPKY
jgi:hypothetical protein